MTTSISSEAFENKTRKLKNEKKEINLFLFSIFYSFFFKFFFIEKMLIYERNII